MKTLNKLAILLLIIITTLPKVIQTYKTIYNEYIKNKEIIEEKVKGITEADIKIKTTYVDEIKDYSNNPKVQALFRRQRASIERGQHGKL